MIVLPKRWIMGVIAAFSITTNVDAAVLSPEVALLRISTDAPRQVKAMNSNTPRLSHTFLSVSTRQATIYAFDSPGGGYMLVSAESEVAPLLGYVTSGSFDLDDIPSNMKAWLMEYSDEIDYIRSSGYKTRTAADYQRPQREPISPMVTTFWNQSAPYNIKCPIDPVTGKQVVTGCVATAMAQVMNYHRWPDRGEGYNSYAWNNISVAFDFGSTTFDWENMLSSYDDTATETQKDAVATLMSACGVAVDMDYSSSSSGASGTKVFKALNKYFKYDFHITNVSRDYYSISQWEDIVYDQLSKVGPILYCGTSTGGGHEFVCDGYSSDGYFHINWGWGGKSDGYFLLTTLNPYEQGIGGGSNSGFFFNQAIVGGMTRDYLPGQKYASWGIDSEPAISIPAGDITVGTSLSYSFKLRNMACYPQSGTVGMIIARDGGGEILAGSMTVNDVAVDATKVCKGSFTVPADIADGVYTVAPGYIDYDDEIKEIPVKQTYHPRYTMTVAGGQVHLTQDPPTSNENMPKVENLRVVDRAIVNKPVKIAFTLYNDGEGTFSNFIYAGLTDESQKGIFSISEQAEPIEIAGGERRDFELEIPWSSSLSAKNWWLSIYSKSPLLPTMGYMKVGDPVEIAIGYPYPESISLPSTMQLGYGRAVALAPVTQPDPCELQLTWTTSDATVADVDIFGKITGKSLGKATIKVTTSNQLEATTEVEVSPSVNILADNVSLKVGETLTLDTETLPSGAVVNGISWTSDNALVATVDAGGTIKAVKPGKAVVTVTASGVTSSCTVTVAALQAREFPATEGAFVYDYVDNSKEALKITGSNNTQSGAYVEIPDNIDGIPVTTIAQGAMTGTTNGIKGVSVPEGVTTIEAGAVSGTSLYSLSLPASLVELGDKAINCTGVRKLFIAPGNQCDFTGKITISSSGLVYVDKMPDNPAFAPGRYRVVSQLSSLFVKDNVVYVPTGINTCEAVDYRMVNNVVEVELPPVVVNGINSYVPEKVGSYFCFFASNVTSVSIPATIKEIGVNAFGYMNKLTDIICEASSPDEIVLDNKVFISSASHVTLHVPSGSLTQYQDAEQWKDFKEIVEMEAVTPGILLSDSKLSMRPGDKTLLVATGVPGAAFPGPFEMTSDNPGVAIVDAEGVVTAVANGVANITVTSSGYTATCKVKVSDVVVRDFPCQYDGLLYDFVDESETELKVTGVGTGYIYAATIPDNIDGVPVTTIGEKAFASKAPRSLNLPLTITTIENQAFATSSGIQYVNIPQSVRNIAPKVFSIGVKRIVWESELEPEMKNYGLASTTMCVIYVSKQPEAVSDSRFRVLPRLAERIKRNGIIYVPTSDDACVAINYESQLVSGAEVVIPSEIKADDGRILKVDRIGDNFQKMSSGIAALNLPSTITKIESDAFNGCSQLVKVKSAVTNPSAIEMGTTVFKNVPFDKCVLTVPMGTSTAYAGTPQWSDFINIEEADLGPSAPSITLTESDIKLVAGKTRQLGYTITPDDAVVGEIMWQSLDEKIAVVDAGGVVTAVSPGNTKVVAGNGEIADTCEVTVLKGSDREFPVTLGGIIYDYTDDDRVSLAVVGYDSKTTQYASIEILPEIDGLKVTSVGKNALARGKMRRIVVGNNVEEIGDSAFYNCSAASIYLPASVRKLGSHTFYLTSNYLRKVFCQSPSSLDLEAAYLKGYNDFVIYVKEMPEGSDKKYIDAKYAVYPHLDRWFESDGVIYIPVSDTECHVVDVAYGNETVLDIPRQVSDGKNIYTVTSLNIYSSFYNNKLKELLLPSSISSIGLRSFYYNTSLKQVTLKQPAPSAIELGANVFEGVKVANATLTVPRGSGVQYGAAPQWMDFGTITELEDVAPSITITPADISVVKGNKALIRCNAEPEDYFDSPMEWISTDESVATVDANGLVTGISTGHVTITVSCKGLSASCYVRVVDMPEPEMPVVIDNVEYDWADINHTSLVVTNARSSALYNKQIVLEQSVEGVYVTGITPNAFKASSAVSVIIPEGYVVIGDSAFINSSCYSLSLPSTIKEIGKDAFKGCVMIKKIFNSLDPNISLKDVGMAQRQFVIYVPQMPETPEFTAISYVELPRMSEKFECDAIFYVPLEEDATVIAVDIDYSAIGDSVGIPPMVDDYTVSSLGSYLMAFCSKVKSVEIPLSVSSIGMSSFYKCTGLEKVYVNKIDPSGIEMGATVFNGCNCSEIALIVPDGSAKRYSVADQWKDFGTILERDPTTGIESVISPGVDYMLLGNTLTTSPGVYIMIYDLGGRCLYYGDSARFTFTRKGVYVIKHKGGTDKIVVR